MSKMKVVDHNKPGLYKVRVFKGGKQIAVTKAVAWTRRDAYIDCGDRLPPHETWDAERIRNAKLNEKPGMILCKNDFKRKH